MPRLDTKTRTRVLCDDFGLCQTEFGTVQDTPEGRVFAYHLGWYPNKERVWDKGRIRRLPQGLQGVTGLEQVPQLPSAAMCPRHGLKLLTAEDLDVVAHPWANTRILDRP